MKRRPERIRVAHLEDFGEDSLTLNRSPGEQQT